MIQIEGADPDAGTFMFSEYSHGQAESQKVSSTLARNFFPPKILEELALEYTSCPASR